MRPHPGGPRLELRITDPEAEILERPGLVWILSGLDEDARRRIASGGGDDQDELESEVLRGARDASIIKLRLLEERPVALVAWRGAMSDHQVFWSRRDDGALGVADHFRNILAWLPPGERDASEQAVVEHFLYRQVLGRLSYCENVRRAGHGEKVCIDPASGDVSATIFDRIESHPKPGGVGAWVEGIDRALASVLEPLRTQEGVANQFSGGVDSTLLQTYLGAGFPAVTVVPDTPEFTRETGYAERAAALLGLELERRGLAEAGYLEQLEETIDDMGLPPIHEGTVLDREVYRTGFRKYVVGEHGDSVFGLGGRRARIAWLLRSGAARRLVALGASWLPAALAERFDGLDEVAQGLAREPSSPSAYPVQRNLYTDPGLAEAIFGADRIRERLVASWDYMAERVVLAAPRSDRFLRHLEAARWIGAFDDVVLPQRHLAQARGKSVCSPFAASAVLESALSVPIDRRYLRGLQDKYLLKRLLKQRLPGYPVRQRKLSTELPFERYYTTGPLARVWERYPMPAFIDASLAEAIVRRPSWVTWNALTWAIWSERVAGNPDLQPVPTTRIRAWDLGASARAARSQRTPLEPLDGRRRWGRS